MKGTTEMQDMICYDLKAIRSQQCYFKIFAPCRHLQIRTQAQLFFSGPFFLKKQSSSQTLKRVFRLPHCSLCDHRDQTVAPQTWRHGKQSLHLPLSPVPVDLLHPAHPSLPMSAMKAAQTWPGLQLCPFPGGTRRGDEWQEKWRAGGCFGVPMLRASDACLECSVRV